MVSTAGFGDQGSLTWTVAGNPGNDFNGHEIHHRTRWLPVKHTLDCTLAPAKPVVFCRDEVVAGRWMGLNRPHTGSHMCGTLR